MSYNREQHYKKQNNVLATVLLAMGLGLVALGGTAVDLYQETFRWRQFARKSCETVSIYKAVECTTAVKMMDTFLRENGVDYTVRTVMGR